MASRIHSPYIYELTKNVIYDKRNFYDFQKIEGLRKKLLKNKKQINIVDLGAGSKIKRSLTKSISEIAKNSAKQKKYGQLFFKLVNHNKYKTIIELGTSLGISTSYLASGNKNAQVITIEGSKEIAKIAQENFNTLNLDNIKSINAPFDEVIDNVLEESNPLDLLFIDGNHRKEATIRYFKKSLGFIHDQSIVIIDDIYWSKEMTEAWEYIKDHPKVSGTINLYQLGLVFFNPKMLQKTNYYLFF